MLLKRRPWLATILALLFASACCPAELPFWWESYSPNRTWLATISTQDDHGQMNVQVIPTIDGFGYDLDAGRLLYSVRDCPILYVFWTDNESIEIVLSPTDPDCRPDVGTVEPVSEIDVTVSVPKGTSKADIAALLGSP